VDPLPFRHLVDLRHSIAVAHAALNESGQVSHASRHHRVAHHDGQTAVPEANPEPRGNPDQHVATNGAKTAAAGFRRFFWGLLLIGRVGLQLGFSMFIAITSDMITIR